jgi:hypothetical protein
VTWLALLTPGLCSAAADLLRRPALIARFDRLHALGYAASLLLAAAVWAALLRAACDARPRLRRAGGVIFVVFFTVAEGVESATYALHHAYFSLDSAHYVASPLWIILGSLPPSARVAAHAAGALLTAVALLALARRALPRRAHRRPILLLFPLPLIVCSGALPASYAYAQASAPEHIYFQAVSWALGNRVRRAVEHDTLLARVQRRAPPPLPALHAKPARPRNVLFILQEALRADMTCSAFDPACSEANQATNALLPDRLPLLALRSNGSSTIVSFAAIFSGLDPVEPSSRLHAAPLLWEYAHAAGIHGAFWTSQHPMFGNYRLFWQDLPLAAGCSGAELDPLADLLAGPSDELLTDRVIRDWDALPEPFFAVAQYSNIHFPRVFDPRRAPFQPSDPFQREEPWRNHYRNVAYLSDLAVARLVEHARRGERGARTVIVFSSDHGEALDEHGNENFHAASVYDEEIRVPFWIDAPPGTLADAELAEFRARREEPLFQLDLGPTFLDLLGLWDEPALAPFRAAMPGRPFTRAERRRGPVPLTNVSWIWEYWKPNWGMMDWPRKVLAGPEDTAFRCFDLEADPAEKDDLGEAACAPLVAAARARYGMLPIELRDHLRDAPRWGQTP